MDWNMAIERNRDALKRILAALVAMAGLADADPGFPSRVRGGGTLPRYLHTAVLRLLRPAESAVRRLVIVAARSVVVAPPPPRSPLNGGGSRSCRHYRFGSSPAKRGRGTAEGGGGGVLI